MRSSNEVTPEATILPTITRLELDQTSRSDQRTANALQRLTALPRNVIRQILGLNPFRTSYFSLYRPMNTLFFRWLIMFAIVLAVLAGIPLPIIGIIWGKLIDGFPPSEEEMRVRLTQLLCVATAYFVITWGWAFCWSIIGEKITKDLREQLVERALGMEMAYFELECPDIGSRLTADTQAIQLGTSEKVGLFIQSISYFTVSFIVSFWLSPKLAGILFAAIIPAMLLVICCGTTLVSRMSRKATEFAEQAATLAEDAIRAVMDIQVLRAESLISDKHNTLLSKAFYYGVRKSFASAVMLGFVYFIAYAANGLAFWEGSRQIASGSNTMSTGTVYAVVFLILDASFVIGQFGPFIQTFAVAAAAGRNVFTLLDHPESQINVYSTKGVSVTEKSFQEAIIFSAVTFVYPVRPTIRVLESLNLRIEPGKLTALVGASGSGKSTIASLLLRLYDPNSGKITIGKHDIRDVNILSLRSRISLVNQEKILFSGTILDNIKHGLKSQSLSPILERKKCIKAAKDANAWSFISALPDGIDTDIGSTGRIQLSGGQKQRICLARALVGDPDLLILDEFTSALDSASEALVLEALDSITSKSKCTIVMIAHRLSTIRSADKIVVLGAGHVLEEGTHDSLMEMPGGSYRNMVEAQQLHSSGASTPTYEDRKIEKVSSKVEVVSLPLGASEESLQTIASQSSPTSLLTLISRSIALSSSSYRLLALGLFASLITGFLILGESVIFGHLISILSSDNSMQVILSRTSTFSLLFLALAVIALVSYSLSGICFGVLSSRLVQRARHCTLFHILHQDMSWFASQSHSTPALTTHLSTSCGNLANLSGVIIGTLLSVATSLVGGIILAHIVNWKVAIVLLSAVPLILFAGFFRLRMLARFEQRHQTAYAAAAAIASEACAAISTVASLSREKAILQSYKRAVCKTYSQNLKYAVLANMLLAFALAISFFVYGLAYWWGAKLVREGQATLLQFFIVLPALLFSAQSSGQMFSLAPEIGLAGRSAKAVFELLDDQPTINKAEPNQQGEEEKEEEMESGDVKKIETKSPFLRAKGGRVGLQMHKILLLSSSPNPVLQIPLLDIFPTLTLITGPSGSGKSSLMSLIPRLTLPTSGAISLRLSDDLVPISSLKLSELRSLVTLVPQDPNFLTGTIAFNVSLGRPGARQEEIESACKKACIHEFITSLPSSYRTPIGRSGVLLSGGQRQRLALARAFLRDPVILLLDEATSALDARSEARVWNVIEHERRGKCTIAVSHRLVGVGPRSGCVVVLDGGCVREIGRHDELVDREQGWYRGMWEAQCVSDA